MKTISTLKGETADLFDAVDDGASACDLSREFSGRINPYFTEKYGVSASEWPVNSETIAWAIVTSAFTGDTAGESFL